MTLLSSPPNLPARRVRLVDSFDALVGTPMVGEVNALCWRRELAGNFAEVVAALDAGPGITSLSAENLRGLSLSPEGQQAVACLLEDLDRLDAHGLQPSLDCINGYTHAPQPGPVRTDVCSFHVDSATVEADTYLCTYHGASSWGLLNEQAVRRIDQPDTRAALLQAYGGADDEAFHEWLEEHFYDLHYAPLPGAQPYAFGTGHLWRIATLWPGCPVPPCIHRAPDPVPGEQRLLLIG